MFFSHTKYSVLAACIISCTSLFADGSSAVFSGTVSRIIIENPGGLPKAGISKIVDSDLHTEYSRERIAQHIGSLMKSGLLYDVVVTGRSDGAAVELSYSCIPLPMLRSISAEAGNSNTMKRLPPRLIDKLFTVKPGEPFRGAQCKTDLATIEDMYHEENFHDMRLSAYAEYDSLSNAVDMIVSIDRGRKTFAYDIIIQGNYSIGTSPIASLLHCSERNFLLFEPGYYDPRFFASDAKAIQAYYREEGFLDAEVTVERARGTKPSRVYIIVRIIEGPRYILGSITWKQRVLTSNQLARLTRKLNFEEGEVYNESLPYTAQDIINEYCLEELGTALIVEIATYMNSQSSPMKPVVDVSISIRKTRNENKDPYRIPAKFDQSFTINPPRK